MTINDGHEGGAGTDRSPPETEGRSRRARTSAPEPGFFDSLVAFLRPRVPPSLREEFVEALREGEAGETGFTAGERLMLTNILELHDVRVEDLMVPRTEIQGIPVSATLAETMARFEETGHSRMPVYGEGGLDDPLGMIHIRDMVGHITRAALCFHREGAEQDAPVRSGFDLSRVDLEPTLEALGLMRQILFVPPSMHAAELMARMQASRTQMALVIDEYGGTDGLVSLEDILEMVVGDIEDEHDDEEILVTDAGDDVYYADARADLDEVREVLGDDFDPSAHEADADTIGGLVVNALGRVPAEGEVAEAVPGFQIEVLEADRRRVKRVRLVRVREAPAIHAAD
ncbi:transporter associated domain-containing protein [Aureimonas jatrophae]|uniref:CBS domain-containing protein n=1 Tax=Aureimonas jatrophae TaxID=1166073 RepID=A0A1H0ILR9_9HYPH|nr:hemolysin family protein [Aureimonas jatrophae]MBB3952229.1 CBS domain containing-hemolysin-like protein [Aureimonas jatrophae]SDO31981.1 CBS domain-containing protein [Aureimonas jatrophae]